MGHGGHCCQVLHYLRGCEVVRRYMNRHGAKNKTKICHYAEMEMRDECICVCDVLELEMIIYYGGGLYLFFTTCFYTHMHVHIPVYIWK